MNIYLKNIGLSANGLSDWSSAIDVIRGTVSWKPEENLPLASQLFSANEYRRMSQLTKLALMAGEDALKNEKPSTLNHLVSVFASAGGDSIITDKICSMLCLAEKPVSPILFHNSVYNAPAGYWHIATKAMTGSNTIAAAENSFSAALLTTAVQIVSEKRDALMLVYDQSPPVILKQAFPIQYDFASAFLFTAEKAENTQAELAISLEQKKDESTNENLFNSKLLPLYRNNPAAQVLPLLSLLAQKKSGEIKFDYLNDMELCVKIDMKIKYSEDSCESLS